MSDLLGEYAEKLARAAGWSQAVPDSEGRYRYFLDGGIDLDLFSPDGRTCILSADLGAGPEKGASGESEQLRRVAALAAACARDRRSTVCLAGNRIELYRRLALSRLTPDAFVREVRDFLNDEAWWKEALSGEPAPRPSQSMFSINADGWLSMNGHFGG